MICRIYSYRTEIFLITRTAYHHVLKLVVVIEKLNHCKVFTLETHSTFPMGELNDITY